MTAPDPHPASFTSARPALEPQPATLTSRYHELDLLRFLASLVVVLTHFTYSMPVAAHIGPSFYPLDRVARYGYLAVDLFFMISGFVLLKSARHKTVAQFFVARATRFYPIFWLSCLLTFIGLALAPGGQFTSPVSWRQFLFNMTLLHEFFGQPSINGVYWTLTYELSFCFLVALIIACRLWKILFPIIVGWLAYTLVAGPLATGNFFAYLFIPKYSAFFIAGMLFYLLQTRPAAAGRIHAAMALALGLALRSNRAEQQLVQAFYHDSVPYNGLITAGIITLFFLAFYALVYQKFRLPAHKCWAWLGHLIYPLYLLHGLGAVPLGLLNGAVNKYLLLLGSLILVLVVAWAAHQLVERPLGRVLNRRLRQLAAFLSRPETALLPSSRAAELQTR
jgi:peptidoglycan/LPS O-acetylase OafA/YrhL